MNLLKYGLVLTLIAVLVYCEEERPLVSIEDGLIRGVFKESFDGRKYMAFEGIPYAKPPIQKLRFKEPEPVDPWPGVLDATTTYTCIQLMATGVVIGQEDCLYLNVYVPREKLDPSEDKLDVIVHIHGGAFMLGNPSSMSGPVYLMDRDVVYVNFNYRLGPFGFISVGDSTFHGNYGLKDQVAVLEWVKKNIDRFGGNKDSVTLLGLSAGAASVHLHYFSHISKGLFHRGFAQSGVALNPWAVKQDGWASAKVIIDAVGCSDPNIKVVYRCMKQRSALQIANAIKNLYVDYLIPLTPFAPGTETFLPAAFLNAMPYLHLGSKVVHDVPFLISVTSEEGTLPAAFFYKRIDELNANWTYWLPLLLEYQNYDEERRNEISAKIKEFYFKEEEVTQENFATFVKLCSHRLFHIGAEKSAKLQANATESNVYFIMMGYQGEKFDPLPYEGSNVDLGVGHGYDAKFYYDLRPLGKANLVDEREIEMKNLLIDMLVSFAKTGKPEIPDANFQPVPKSGNLKYLLIKGPDDMVMKSTKRLGAREFWKSLNLREDENIIKIGEKMIEII